MRILSVRGENLASLAAPFEVNLEQEPLKGAGLFAITGETGSGKSTLLDAMCLALFGKCPRLTAEGGDESVPDVSGSVHREKDPKSVLTRGAANGYAEVEFVGADGENYVSRWTVRRARGKASGRLQNVERTLTRQRDEQVIESGIKKVDAMVEEKLGLTYEQFRRTVLLAQGDFDAFLKAGDKERAGLLEKVTGTDIYRSISKRVHLNTNEAETALKQLQNQCDAVGLMEPDEREALGNNILENEALRKQREAALASLKVGAQTLERIQKSKELLSQAQDQFVNAQKSHDAQEPQRALHGQLKTVQSLEPLAKREDVSSARRDGALKALEQARQNLSLAAESQTAAEQRHGQEKTAFEELEAQVKSFEPVWETAQQLDDEIRVRDERVAEARSDHQELSSQHQTYQGQLSTKQVQLKEQTEQRQKLKEQLERLKPAQILHDRAGDILSDLDRLEANEATLENLRLETSSYEEKQAELAELKSQLEEELEGLVRQRSESSKELEAARTRLEENDQDALLEEKQNLDRLEGLVSAAERDSRFPVENKRLLQELGQQIEGLNHSQISLADKIRASERKLEECLKLEAEAGERASWANAAKEEVAERLRLTLVEEQPCPVCGSKDHPFTEDSSPEMSTLVAKLLAQREDAERVRVLVQEELSSQRQELFEKKTRLEQLQKEQAQRSVDLARQLEELAEQLSDICKFSGRAKLEGSLSADDVLAKTSRWAEFVSVVEQACERVNTQLASVREQQKTVNTLSGSLNELQGKLSEGDKKVKQKDASLQSVIRTRTELDGKNSVLLSGTADIRSRLSSLLEKAEIDFADPNTDFEELKKHVRDKALEWETCLKHYDLAKAQVQQLEPETAGLRERVLGLETQVKQKQQLLGELSEKLKDTFQKRSTLLDGAKTLDHKRTWKEKFEQLQTAYQNAKDAFNEATQKQAIARINLDNCQNALAAEEKELSVVTTELANAIEPLSLSREEFSQLRAKADQELEQLEHGLKAVDQELESAKEQVRLRSEDLEELNRKDLPQQSLKDLQEIIATKQSEQDALLVTLGSLREQQRADEQARERAAAIMADIEQAQEHFNAWGAVNRVIGSAEGDKFQKLAQAVTLDLLVELANKQLKALKPRYRLLRATGGLGLLVEDLDMGSSPRSARSLSGGERFLISLSLALALSGLEGRQSFVDTLFIDEGFGSLDGDTLDVAIDALEMLQGQGRKVGVISHVEAMKDRIPVQVRVVRQGAGRSRIELTSPASW
ncbi:SbcC/MukB-like Walker B domain-containing protein [Flexibacterium corallicola]|uniref:SbcC/MukB-like Walker B domain-containing protein n=1 Tax=Flexibacterium corallicola TaxID=3037259 RepID=UPI00286F3D65|nr:AAA family ATPase [Pseudovibrio sp. M1P-2-3]